LIFSELISLLITLFTITIASAFKSSADSLSTFLGNRTCLFDIKNIILLSLLIFLATRKPVPLLPVDKFEIDTVLYTKFSGTTFDSNSIKENSKNNKVTIKKIFSFNPS